MDLMKSLCVCVVFLLITNGFAVLVYGGEEVRADGSASDNDTEKGEVLSSEDETGRINLNESLIGKDHLLEFGNLDWLDNHTRELLFLDDELCSHCRDHFGWMAEDHGPDHNEALGAVDQKPQGNYSSHAPVRIDSNDEFNTSDVVTGGSGREDDPWVIEGFDIDGGGNGCSIYIGNTTDPFVIRNCSLHNASGHYEWPYFTHSGLLFNNVTNGFMTNNTIFSNGFHGAYVYNSTNITLENNTVLLNDFSGITIDTSEGNTVRSNNVSSNDECEGIYLYRSNNNSVVSNNASDNYDGIFIRRSGNNRLEENTILSYYCGIYIYSSSDNSLNNNTVSDNRMGIELCASRRNKLSGNVMEEDGICIWGERLPHWNTHMIDSSNTVNGKPVYYWKNRTSGTIPDGAGEVLLANCSGITVKDQNLSDSSTGLEVGHSDHITISDTSVYSNHDLGIKLYFSDNNTLDNNIVSSNINDGIWVSRSHRNILTNNTISSDKNEGIYLSGSNNNTIYHNNLVEDYNQVIDNGDNQWNAGYPLGGNYWGNYTGMDNFSGPKQIDQGEDGIGDDNYSITGGSNVDEYPLMKPVEDGRVKRPPIRIDNNSEFDAAHGVVAGNGTEGDPWLIENWEIDGGGNGYSIFIANTTDHFLIRVCHLHNATDHLDLPYFQESGVHLYNVSNGTIKNNDITDNQRHGVLISSSSYNKIIDNTVSSNGMSSIYINSSENNTLHGNSMNEKGIFIRGSQLSHWSDQSIDITNTVSGRPVYYCKNLTNETVPKGAGQVILVNCTKVKVESQDIRNSSAAIEMAFSKRNLILNNNLSNNYYGISLYSSINNTIYHNNFINNTNQASYDGDNRWNESYPYGGNYWSDYNGMDNYSGSNQDKTGSDGIGDTNYTVSNGTDVDRYPLMNPVEDGKIIRGPIRINNNSDFDAAHGVVGGNGTESDPWIIEDLKIDGEGSSNCIYIGNTTDHFTIRDCYLHNASGRFDPPFFTGSGIQFYGVQYGMVKNNTVYSNDVRGISLHQSNDSRLTNNTVSSNGDHGIYLNQSKQNDISFNTISSNDGDGIKLRYSDSSTVKNNTLLKNHHGISIDSSSNQTLHENKMKDDGIFLRGSQLPDWNTHSILLSNKVNGRSVYYWKNRENGTVPRGAGEIILANCTGVTVKDQDISNGTAAIELGFSQGNTIENNTASDNDCGFYFFSSTNNTIYHNSLINNTDQALDGGYNQWNASYPYGGNYWSDYDGVDNYSGPNQSQPGGDGIGDTNYTVSGGKNADEFPLMKPIENGAIKRPPIRINSDADFDPAHGVVGGNGTQADPWIIEGWEIDGEGNGTCIYIGNTSDHFVVRDCYLHNASGRFDPPFFTGSGIQFYSVQDGMVKNNTVYRNDKHGLHLYQSDNNKIYSNEFSSNDGNGIYIYQSNSDRIENNTVYSNGIHGVSIYQSNYNRITDLTISSNGEHGISLYQSKNNVLSNNTASSNHGHGVGLEYSDFNEIKDSNLSSNNRRGISVYRSKNDTLENNTLSNNDIDIELDSSSNNTLDGNVMGSDGLSVHGSQLLHWNTHYIDLSNTVDGKPVLYWKDRTNGTVPDGPGEVILANCSGVSVKDQIISDSSFGIEIGFSDNNTLVNNTIINNGHGLYLFSSKDNTIYYNNLMNNTIQASDDGDNLWNAEYPLGGNYWSDYNGDDNYSGPNQDQQGSDGIGDANYTIQGDSNADRYPLMNPIENGVIKRPPIRINSDSEFDPAHGVVGGNGTQADPWIIEGWEIDGEGNSTCIYIGNTSDHFIIRDCYLHNASGIFDFPYFSESGIQFYNVDNGLIKNNTLSTNERYGISLYLSNDNIISNNEDTSNDDHGIYFYSSSNNRIKNNVVQSNHDHGISFYQSNLNLLKNNTVSSNLGTGLYLYQSNDNLIENQTISSNCEHGVSLYQSNDNRITSDSVSSNKDYGIFIDQSNENMIDNNTVISNVYRGLTLSQSKNNTISDNTVTNNSFGIHLFSSSDYNDIGNNVIFENEVGVFTRQSSDNTLSKNNISFNEDHGIRLRYSDHNDLVNNSFSRNNGSGIDIDSSKSNTLINNSMKDEGIQLHGSKLIHWNTHSIDPSNTCNGRPVYYWKNRVNGTIPADAGEVILANCTGVTVEDQKIKNVTMGIELGFSDGNTITNNTLLNNGHGVYLSSSTGNSIYHNNLINNTDQARDSGSNQWDDGYPSGGNYWGDYDGFDNYSGTDQDQAGSDGIGDTGYDIPGDNNTDRYPLIDPFTDEMIERPPIKINDDSEFDPAHGISAGNGSKTNPWVIEGFDINGTGYGYCIFIGNTTDHFVVRGCSLHDSAIDNNSYFAGSGVHLENVSNGVLSETTIFSNNRSGVYLDDCAGSKIDNNSLYSHQNSDIYLFNSDKNNLTNNNCSDDDADIRLNSSDENTLTNNDAASLYLTRSHNNVLSDNTLWNTGGYGISVHGSDNNILTDNQIYTVEEYAVYLNSSVNTTLSNNTMDEGGLFIKGSKLVEWNTHSIGISNTVDGGPVYYWKNRTNGTVPQGAGQIILANCTGVSIENQSLDSFTAGIVVSFSYENDIVNNSVYNTTDRAVYLYSSIDNTIMGNTISNNTDGIFLDLSSNNTFLDNTISNNKMGVRCGNYSSDNLLYNNTISGNDDGIYLNSSGNNALKNNTVSNNIMGIRLNTSINNSLTDNSVSGNDHGIYFNSSDKNELAGNNISKNMVGITLSSLSEDNSMTDNYLLKNDCGIEIYFSNNNSIYHNDFIDNTDQTSINGSYNIWHDGYPSGGNYWSDYNGVDNYSGPNQTQPGTDGIGDTNYTIGGSNVDEYPLIHPNTIIINVHEGWNFISLPCLNESMNIEEVLSDISWDEARIYIDDEWDTYIPSRPPQYNQGFPKINNTHGFWLHAIEDGLLHRTTSYLNTTDITIRPGWNMAGYPSIQSRSARETLPTEVTEIGVFNASCTDNIEYIQDLSNYSMRPGHGFWIYNSGNHTVNWTVEY